MTNILVIEDDFGIRNFIRQAVSEKPWELHFAGDGRLALAAARALWPHAVLLDLGLPGRMDGWQVWHELQTRRRGRPLSVILLTGQLSALERAQAHTREAQAVLQKPISKGQLLTALSGALFEGEYAA
jgi:CheY-like chemotaxis protein